MKRVTLFAVLAVILCACSSIATPATTASPTIASPAITDASHLKTDPTAKRDLIFVSGMLSSSAYTGSEWLEHRDGAYADWGALIRQIDTTRYRRLVLLSYGSAGPTGPWTSADTCAPSQAATNLARYLEDNQGIDVDLVAHSLGGAVIVHAYNEAIAPPYRGAIRSVVTLDSPVMGKDGDPASIASVFACGALSLEKRALWTTFLAPSIMKNFTQLMTHDVDLWNVANRNDLVVPPIEAVARPDDLASEWEIRSGTCPNPRIDASLRIVATCPAHDLAMTLLADASVVSWVTDHLACDGPRRIARTKTATACVSVPSVSLTPTPTGSPGAAQPTNVAALHGLPVTPITDRGDWSRVLNRNKVVDFSIGYPQPAWHWEVSPTDALVLLRGDSTLSQRPPQISLEYVLEAPPSSMPGRHFTAPLPITVAGIVGATFEDLDRTEPQQWSYIALPYRRGKLLIKTTIGPAVDLTPQLREFLKTIQITP